jgi:hypothetical protein
LLRLANLEQIEGLLLAVPSIVRSFENREPEFMSSIMAWLLTAEKTLANNHLPDTSEIATKRAMLISVQRGLATRLAGSGQTNTRRARDARAADLLKEAADVVAAITRPRRAQVAEAERLMMQAVAVADRLGLISVQQDGQSHTSYLQSIFQAMYNRSELASLVVHVVGLLGNTDALIILDRSITNIRQ